MGTTPVLIGGVVGYSVAKGPTRRHEGSEPQLAATMYRCAQRQRTEGGLLGSRPVCVRGGVPRLGVTGPAWVTHPCDRIVITQREEVRPAWDGGGTIDQVPSPEQSLSAILQEQLPSRQRPMYTMYTAHRAASGRRAWMGGGGQMGAATAGARRAPAPGREDRTGRGARHGAVTRGARPAATRPAARAASAGANPRPSCRPRSRPGRRTRGGPASSPRASRRTS